MDTTQKTREEAVHAAPPPSAQQNNGAMRTEEEQRTTAGKPKARPAARKQPAKKGAAGKKAVPAKRKQPAGKKPAVKKSEIQDVPDRKRAYGNSKPKKTVSDKLGDAAKQRQEKKIAKAKAKGKAIRPKQPTPAVIYTEPAAFNRSRLLVQLVTVVSIVAALIVGLSVFFKVEHITVSGAKVYDEWAIKKASGLVEGQDNLLTFSRPRAGALIKANLPYVDTVRFGIKLPDTVNIIVKEDQVAYAIKDQDGTWWMMNSDGRVVEMGDNSKASNNTQVLGVTLDAPVADERGVATEAMTTETTPEGELAPVTVTGAQRLTAALQILRALEANGIVGDVASVDVSRLEDIILWYGTRYQVNLGDSAALEYKIACMNDVILQMNDWQSGILDISFTIWPNQVGYTPFG